MALTRDKYQLDITFITDDNRALAKTIEATKDLPRELRKAQQEGKGVAEVMKKIEQAGASAEKVDLGRVLPAQLITRGKQIQQILKQIPETAPQAKKLEAEYKAINDRLAEMRSRTRGVTDAFGKEKGGGLLGFLKSGAVQFLSFAAAGTAAFSALRKISDVSAQFQKFEAVLTNTLGSKSAAQEALSNLTDFAAQTPFQVDELIGSYVKLVNRGLKPTQNELVQLGDIAASQGKGFDQLVEAVLDAGTGEFERLKEFGIRAKTSGDQVTLAFKDQEIQVAKTQEAITAAVLGFGDLQGVQGSTAAISATLGGKISNLGDKITQMWKALGEGIIGDGISAAVDVLSSLAGWVSRVSGEEKTRADNVRESQADFNLMIDTLKDANLSEQARSKLITEINTKYGDYLPNLLTEESTLGEIARAQELANREFEKKIVLLATEDQLKDITKRRLDAMREEVELGKKLTAANARIKDARERAFNEPNTQNFAGVSTAKGIAGETGAKSLAEQARERLDENRKLQDQLTEELALTRSKAEELGLDVLGILNGGGAGIAGGGGAGEPKKKDPLGDALKKLKDTYAIAAQLAEQSRLREEISESDYQKRLLELKAEEYQRQLDLFKKYNKQKSLAAEEARTDLLRTEQQLKPRGQTPVAAIEGTEVPGSVERRGVNAQLDAVERQAEKEADRLQQVRNKRLIDEDQFALARLQLKRNVLDQEIEILRTGSEEEVQQAAEKADRLKEIDQQLFDKRLELAEREAEFKNQLQQTTTETLTKGADAAIDLLGRDEEARKKNAGAIKAFQKGQIVIAGLNEVQQIKLATAKQSAAAPPGAQAFVIALGIARALAAAVQTGVAVGKVSATKFARGGTPKVGVFGGKPHSQGGTRGYFDDGTQIEVERDETFAIVNKNARGLLAFLSSANQATGGLPFFADGGIARNAPASLPRLSPGALAPAAVPRQDNSDLIAELRAMRQEFSRFPRELKAYVPLTDINKAQYDLDTIEGAAEV